MGIPHYASYFGLTPDLNTGFGILAHDTEVLTPDLNVHADILAEAIGKLAGLAAREMGERYAGAYNVDGSSAVLNVTDGLGVVVDELIVDGADVLAQIAERMMLDKAEDLDMRLYPTNVLATTVDGKQVRQFLAVYQDKAALVDAGTPTCITWQGVGELGSQVVERVTFELGDGGAATRMWLDTLPDIILLREA